MDLKELVPTLETCKRLRDAGFPQDTYAAWIVPIGSDSDGKHSRVSKAIWSPWGRKNLGPIAAPTAAEIGKWLPEYVDPMLSEISIWRQEAHGVAQDDLISVPGGWHVEYEDLEGNRELHTFHENEAEARALMLLDLIDRGLVTFKQEAGADA